MEHIHQTLHPGLRLTGLDVRQQPIPEASHSKHDLRLGVAVQVAEVPEVGGFASRQSFRHLLVEATLDPAQPSHVLVLVCGADLVPGEQTHQNARFWHAKVKHQSLRFARVAS